MTTDIHPTAIVDPAAELGAGVSVGPYALVEAGVEIGEGSKIHAFAQIKSLTRMGKNNQVHPYACIGGDPQDLKYNGEPTVLEIGHENTFREYVTINRGTETGGGATRVGSDCLLMAYVHVAHDCRVGDEAILANAATLGGHVVIGAGVVIGGLSAVHQFARIGDHAFVGGKTGVAQDVPPYMLTAGERARLRGLNLIGLRRRGFSKDAISALKKSYKIIWTSGIKREEALQQVGESYGHYPEVARLVDFIRTSTRGCITPE